MNQLGWKIDRNKEDFEGKQRFSIRKLTIGACSVLLGTLLWTEVDQQVVHADTTEGGTGDVPTSQESSREQNKNESALLDKVISNGGDLENNAGGESGSTETQGNSASNSGNEATGSNASTGDASSTQKEISSSSTISTNSNTSNISSNEEKNNADSNKQQNESITSIDASVGKETEQKTNENKDQPQSAQNNQTANEVKNDVKNVNSTDGTNQAATSTEEMLQKVLKLQHQIQARLLRMPRRMSCHKLVQRMKVHLHGLVHCSQA